MSGAGVTDFGLLRFLRARVGPPLILNAADGTSGLAEPATVDAGALSGQLLRDARLLPEDATAYRALTLMLRVVAPERLGDRPEREAFWINVYNALVLDAIVSLGVRETVREIPGFFRREAYQVGGHIFTAEEIEHGILRGNRPPLAGVPAPFAPGDPRLALALVPLDPRVHFALNCGARSCPPIAAYDPEHVDVQLDLATVSFINGEGARVEDDGTVVISPLFSLYEDDFGGAEGVRAWLLRHLDDPVLRARIAAGEGHAGAYDWRLGG